MTVTALPVRDEYTGTAGQTVFNYTFLIFTANDLNVYITPAGQEADDSTDITTAYTVDTGTIGNPIGGFITLNSGVSVGDLVTIVSNIVEDRTTDYQNSGDFLPDTVNDDFDRVVSLAKQTSDRAGRTLAFQESQQNATELTLPNPDSTKFLRWKSDETGLENVDLTSLGAPTDSSLITYNAGNNFTNGVSRTQEVKNGDIISVKDFGALGNGVADDWQAIQNAVDYIIANGAERNQLFFPAGTYFVSAEIDIFRASSTGIDIDFFGSGIGSTDIKSDFFGAGSALFKGIDPLATDRCAPTTFNDMQIGSVTRSGGVNPICIDVAAFGEGLLNNVKFGPCNNTHLSLGSMQNIRGTNVQSRFGGHSYQYKDTDALTFTVTGSAGTTATLTASAPIFTNGGGFTDDVGLSFLTIPDSGANRIKWTISAFTSSTIVTVTCDTPIDTVLATGFFQSAFGSMTSGSNLLTVNSNVPCFDSTDVGRIIYVKEARSGTSNSKAQLRARIGAVNSSTQVALEDEYGNAINADRNVVNVEFGTPAIDFYTPENGSAGITSGSTDNKFNFLHIENYVGVAICVSNMQQFEIQTSKIEGLIALSSANQSTSTFWLDDVRGEIDCDISTHSAINKVRCYVSDQTGTLIFGNNDNRNFVGGSTDLFYKAEAMTDPDGEVVILNPVFLFAYADISTAFEDDTALADPTDPRVFVHGPVRHGAERERFNGPLSPVSDQLGLYTSDLVPKVDDTQSLGDLSNTLLWQTIATREVTFGSIGSKILNGSVTPNSNVTGDPGFLYLLRNAGLGELHFKTSGIGTNTGWVLIV